jgi:arsenate reductase (glutaredoxin)
MFFKERRIDYQFVNLEEKPMSRGELQSVLDSVSPDELIDRESKEFRKQNLGYMKFDIASKLLENPLLFKTPIVRESKRATSGFAPDIWKKWINP